MTSYLLQLFLVHSLLCDDVGAGEDMVPEQAHEVEAEQEGTAGGEAATVADGHAVDSRRLRKDGGRNGEDDRGERNVEQRTDGDDARPEERGERRQQQSASHRSSTSPVLLPSAGTAAPPTAVVAVH